MQPSHSIPRRVREDVTVEPNSFIRVHCHPKRFPAAYAYEWEVGSRSFDDLELVLP